MQSIKYRPDIDGLRCVAVSCVVLHHAAPYWLPGGFIGVDIFFVISGFLISSIILGQLQSGSFTISGFYVRRIKRIFPALLVVLVSVLIFGWIVLLQPEFQQLGKHTAAGGAFISNIVFWSEVGYFDNSAETKPLLHLWSLGVEEQFYILWPIMLAGLWARRWALRLFVIGLTVLSFITAVVTVAWWPDFAFYMPFTRFWELTAGGILAYFHLKDRLSLERKNAVAFVGLLLLVIALATINRQRLFPGFWALLPAGGACCLIAAGPNAFVNKWLLSSRLMVWLGLISFPIYLWHWPLLSFGRLVYGQRVPVEAKIILLASTVILSAATYYFIELRIRRSTSGHRIAVWLFSFMMAITLTGLLVSFGAISQRMDSKGAMRFLEALNDTAFPGPNLARYRFEGETFQRLSTPARTTTVFLGDSVAEHYLPRVESLYRSRPSELNNVVFATSGGCIPVPGLIRRPLVQFPSCRQRTELAYRLARQPEVSSVILSAAWYGYLSPPIWADIGFDDGRGAFTGLSNPAVVERVYKTLETELSVLVGLGKSVYIVLPSPSGPRFDPRNMYTGSRFDDIVPLEKLPPVELAEFEAGYSGIRDRLVQMASRVGAHLIDPAIWTCRSGQCPVVDAEGRPIYKDSMHMRPQFARAVGGYIDEAVLSK